MLKSGRKRFAILLLILAFLPTLRLNAPAEDTAKAEVNMDEAIANLRSEDYYQQLEAEHNLVKIGEKALPPLIELLDDQDPRVKTLAAETLGKIGDVKALRPLVSYLDDQDVTMRVYVVNALGCIKSASAVKPLIKCLQDENWEVRKSAAEVLGGIGDSQAIKPLIAALEDENAGVRENAAVALRFITSQDFGQDHIKWQQWSYGK